MKHKAFFIIFKGLSIKQIEFFFERWESDFNFFLISLSISNVSRISQVAHVYVSDERPVRILRSYYLDFIKVYLIREILCKERNEQGWVVRPPTLFLKIGKRCPDFQKRYIDLSLQGIFFLCFGENFCKLPLLWKIIWYAPALEKTFVNFLCFGENFCKLPLLWKNIWYAPAFR